MLILLETPAGFALFQVTNEKKLSKIEDISEFVKDTDKASKLYVFISIGNSQLIKLNL